MCAILDLARIIVVRLYTDFLCWLFSFFSSCGLKFHKLILEYSHKVKPPEFILLHVNATIYGLILNTRDN